MNTTSVGSFFDICRTASVLPVCSAFVLRGDKQCTLQGVTLGTTKITDVVDVGMCVIALILTVYIAFRTHSKYAAVGRSEMGILNLLFFMIFAIQIVSVGGWMTSEPELLRDLLLWTSIGHTALIATAGWVVLLNGIVGFQFVPDGSPKSVYSIAFRHGPWHFGHFVPGPALASVPLMVLVLVIPAVAAVLYTVLQVVLVVTQLSARRPLSTRVLLVHAFLCQTWLMLAMSLCNGKAFNTLFTLVAFALMHKYWSEITEDEWEDFEDQF
ncbi:chitin synthase III catalytic subunit [Catenaria anguillulae PL171]|uniref:Chitin synthase III catalytic subunit n=1 Tax=Catenaria anguillulae PL171 TaxID=765915 RepID=A0A1Y2HYL9_9FUNG|nr:chitin synthase III catalytic subunit [Catenaria anguillulae PL171]